jgi:hypothetical protein
MLDEIFIENAMRAEQGGKMHSYMVYPDLDRCN